MGKGGGGNSTTTQKSDPWSGQQPFLIGGGGGFDPMTGQMTSGTKGIFPEAERLYGQQGWSQNQNSLAGNMFKTLQQRQGQSGNFDTMAGNLLSGGFDPKLSPVGNTQGAGQIGHTNLGASTAGPTTMNAPMSVGSFDVTGRSAMGALGDGNPTSSIQSLLSGQVNTQALDPVVNNAMRRMSDSFNEQVMPGINSGAQMAGQYGGSRHGIAQGLAAKGLSLAQGDMAANMYNNAFNTAQSNMYGTANNQANLGFANAQNNAARGLQAQTTNAGNQLATGQFNANSLNNMGQFNASALNNMGQFNADRNMQSQLANASNDLNTQQFNSNLGLQNNAQAMTSGQQNLSNRLQGLNVLNSGNSLIDSIYGQQQGLLDAGNQYNWNNLNRYASIVQPGSGIGGSQTTTSPNNTNPGAGMLGGALAGAQLAGLLGTSSGWGAGLGALAMLSDRRTKTDIEAVGRLDNGLTVYRYRYKAGGPLMLGVMADEVKAVNPGAVVNVGGVDYVNYGEI